MPRWSIHSTAGTISPSSKDTIAAQVTSIYTSLGLPAFFVNVFFYEHAVGTFYSGGKARHESVFFHIDHAARKFESDDVRSAFVAKVNSIMEPILGPTKKKWEYNIYEHPRDNWRINGMIPPIDHADVLKQWVERDEAVPWEGSGLELGNGADVLDKWADLRERNSF